MSGPVAEGSIWVQRVTDDVFSPGPLAPRSRRQDLKVLRDVLVDWATMESDWLTGPTSAAVRR